MIGAGSVANGPCTVLACGDPSRGDDGAAIAAANRLTETHRRDVRLRIVGQLEPGDVVEALLAGSCIVVDAVHGIEPGEVVLIPLRALAAPDGPHPASSHALPIEIVIGLAEALGADLDRGSFVGIGGCRFDLGTELSEPVQGALVVAAAAIDRRIRAMRTGEPALMGIRPCA